MPASSPAPIRIGVLGPNRCGAEEAAEGYAVGAEIARRGAILVCGGLDGMMQAAARGAREAGGCTIGFLPGDDAAAANPFVEIPLPTGLGPFRNMILVQSCTAVIAVHGEYGTLSEIAFALRLGIPVVGLHTWRLFRGDREDPGIHVASTPEEAVALAWQRIGARPQT